MYEDKKLEVSDGHRTTMCRVPPVTKLRETTAARDSIVTKLHLQVTRPGAAESKVLAPSVFVEIAVLSSG